MTTHNQGLSSNDQGRQRRETLRMRLDTSSQGLCYHVSMRRMDNCVILGSIPILVLIEHVPFGQERGLWEWEWVPYLLDTVKQDGGLLRSCLEIVHLKRLQFLWALPTWLMNLDDLIFCRVFLRPASGNCSRTGSPNAAVTSCNTWWIRLHHFHRYIWSKILMTTDDSLTIPCVTVLLTNHKNAMPQNLKPVAPNKTRTSMQLRGKPSEHTHDHLQSPLGGWLLILRPP